MARFEYAPGTGDAPNRPTCARTRPVWRCSSSFASADKPVETNRPALPEHDQEDVLSHRHTRKHDQKKGQKNVGRTQHHTKPQIVVAVVGVIPVAIGTAGVVLRIVPRAAAHDLSRLPDRALPPGEPILAQNRVFGPPGEVSPGPPPESEWPEEQSTEHPRPELRNRGRTQHHTKPQTVEAVVGVKPVAIGTAGADLRIVPRAAAHDP